MGSSYSTWNQQCDGTGRNCPNAIYGSPCHHRTQEEIERDENYSNDYRNYKNNYRNNNNNYNNKRNNY